MYFNDPYDITNENDYDNEFKSDDEYNTLDKGYNKIKQKVNGGYKYIEYYKTPNRPGAMIRDATTGYNTNALVGSLNLSGFCPIEKNSNLPRQWHEVKTF